VAHRSEPAGGDVVDHQYREHFATPWDLGKIEVKTTTGAGEEQTAIVDALERPVRPARGAA
jgi:hypothetical protein